jgi:hypothetical protein
MDMLKVKQRVLLWSDSLILVRYRVRENRSLKNKEHTLGILNSGRWNGQLTYRKEHVIQTTFTYSSVALAKHVL